MSEYQFYRFECQDSILSAAQQTQLRQISNRAEIGATYFTVSYHYGDLKAEPEQLIAEHFDIGFYYANWGQVVCYLKLTVDCIGEEYLAFVDGWRFELQQLADCQLLLLQLDEDDRFFDDNDARHYIKQLHQLRRELLKGDRRLLYLLWLNNWFDSNDDLAPMPKIGFDFNQLSQALQAMMQLLVIPEEVPRTLALALGTTTPKLFTELSAAQQLGLLSQEAKDHLLFQLFTEGELTVAQAQSLLPAVKPVQVVEWLTIADMEAHWQTAHQAITAEYAERAALQQQYEQQQRQSTLKLTFADRDNLWFLAQANAEKSQAASYDKAANLLTELFEAYQEHGELADFVQRYLLYVRTFQQKKALLKRLHTLQQIVLGYLPEH